MKILNLYAGIGGNRKLWGGHEITAVEKEISIARVYKSSFPKDKVIITDAHSYLLKHYKEFDFIWSSPPCPTHSRTNTFLNAQGVIRYPDMKLYQEIIFLKHWFKGKWVVENVISYYDPLITPQICGRHYIWSNFSIQPFREERNFKIGNARKTTRVPTKDEMRLLQEYHGINLDNVNVKNKRLLLRNCVNPQLALHILSSAFAQRTLEI